MADKKCKIIFKNDQRIGVEDSNGNPSQLFQDILSNPHIQDFQQALDIYLNVTDSPATNITYKNDRERTFNAFQRALRETSTGEIKAGIDREGRFQELFSINVSTNPEIFGGLINNLVKSRILEGTTYQDEQGRKVYRIAGNSHLKKMVNSDMAKTTAQKFMGLRRVKALKNGDLIFNIQSKLIAVENKQGEIEYLDEAELRQPFSVLNRKYEDAIGILASVEYADAQQVFSETPVAEEIIVPENELQQKLMTLLRKMGVKTLSIADYVERYSDKNGVPPSATALADLANLIVAFKDGIITTADLSEETAHFIIASTPKAELENLLRNIHKTQEWIEFSQAYRDIYNDDTLVREEILGKVLANSLQNNFAQERKTATENNIIARLQDIFVQFFEKIRSYFQPSFQQELNTYTQNVYANLMRETLETDGSLLEGRKIKLFSVDRTQNDELTMLYNKASEALDLLSSQQAQLSKNKKLSGTREELRTAKELIERSDRASKIKSLSGIASVAKKQLAYLERAIEQNKTGRFPFSQEENAVYNTFTNHTQQLLSEMNALLSKKDKEEAFIKTQLEDVLKKSVALQGKVGVRENNAVEAMLDRMVVKHNLTPAQREELGKAIAETQKDTVWLMSTFGSLTSARSPLLNLAGDVVARTTTESRQDYLNAIKPFTNLLETLGITPSRLKELRDGNYILNEIDYTAVDNEENRIKTELYNRYAEKSLTPQEFRELERKGDIDLTPEQILFYNREYRQETAKWKESFFTEEYLKKQDELFIDIPEFALDFHKRDRAQRAEIRSNATQNGRVIYDANDRFEIEEYNKLRAEAMNPRDASGELKQGLIETFTDGKYVLDLDTLGNPSEEALLAYGLHEIDRINKEQFDGSRIDTEIPQAFIDELNKLETQEEKLDFLFLNAYVGFPDSFWENFGQNSSILQKLQALENEDAQYIIDGIRKNQQKIAYIQKANRVFNRPSETNVENMSLVERTEIKEATTELEELYRQANKLLPQEETETFESSYANVTNDAYQADTEDLNIQTFEEEINFIQQHVTFNNRRNIDKAIEIGKKLAKGETEIPSFLQGVFNGGDINAEILSYAKSRLLPYYKRTEPQGFSQLLNDTRSGNISVEDFMSSELVQVSPNFSFYDTVSNENINPIFLENKANNRPQIKKGFFESARYKEYFGIKDGQPTRNLEMWKARNGMLELQQKTLENMNLDGKQNLYKLPQVGKRGLRQVQDLVQDFSKRPWKETLNDFTKFREDEMELGSTSEGRASRNLKMRSSVIPAYYTKNLSDEKDVTDELLYSYALMNQQSALYKARVKNIGDMLSVKQALLNQDFSNKESEATNAYKMLKSNIDYNFYGVKQTFSYEINLFGWAKVDVAKVATVFNNWIKKVNLTSAIIPVISWTQGEVQRKIESVVGERINPIAGRLGNAEFFKLARGASSELLGINSKSRLNVLGESFGLYELTENRFENSNYGKFTRGFLKSGMASHSLANFPILSRVLLTVLKNERLHSGRVINYNQFVRFKKLEGKDINSINSEWKTLDMLYDYITTENGVQGYNKEALGQKLGIEGQELDEYLKELTNTLTSRVKLAVQDIDSAIPQEEKSQAARNSLANFFLTHRSYLLLTISRHFKSRHLNLASGEVEEGSYITALRFFKDLTAGYRKSEAKNYLEHIKQVWQNGDETTRRNLTRTLAEIGFMNALALISVLISNLVYDDDEDPAYALQFFDYILYRTTNEVITTSVGIPNQLAEVLESPIIGIDRLYQAKDVFDVFSSDEATLGGEKTTERWKWMVNNLPAFKEYNRLSDIKKTNDTYKFFNKDSFDMAFMTYLVSQEE